MSLSLPMITPGIAVVTGASSGIGRACSIALAHAGWTVVMSGRRQAELQETFKRAKEAKADVKDMRAVAGDLSKPSDVDALFAVVMQEYGECLLLFRCSGSGSQRREAYSRLLQVVWICCSMCVCGRKRSEYA
jgi:NAD(P)-dependent dehydrogenase (short-subunit alcohol dehydrogenase family)